MLYFFAFLLVSMALTGMWLTNKNVDSAELIDMHADFLFAGEKNIVTVFLKNKNYNKNFKKNYEDSIWDSELQIDPKFNSEIAIEKITEIRKQTAILLTWIPAKRGHMTWPRLILQSRFPYKMLKAWKYLSKTENVLIYPQKAGRITLPSEMNGSAMDGETEKSTNLELFRDFRPFQQTDSPLRIDWKKSLKHQRHLVKNFESSFQKKIIIDWSNTDFLQNFEEKISQLALWIDICEKKNDLYSLRIKAFQTEFDQNMPHYHRCLEKLALLQESEIE